MSSPPILRQANEKDALGISVLYQDVYEGTYPDPMMKDLRMLKAVLSTDEYFWTVAESDGEIVGSTVFRIDAKNRLAKAYGAVVSPAYRGHKITQRLMTFGYDKMNAVTPVEVVYATTRTVSVEPQKLTANLGYKKLGVFPNVHKTESYETHCLTAYISDAALAKRMTDFKLHPKLKALYDIASRECGLEPLSAATPRHAGTALGAPPWPIKFEIIAAPLFVRHRFLDEKNVVSEHEWFYPFHEPNVLLTTPDQSVEVFAFISEADKHCVLIGIRSKDELGLAPVLHSATRALKEKGIRYIEFLIRADEIEKLEAAFQTAYVPSAYFPAMMLSQDKRFDFVVFSRSFEILDFYGTHLEGLNLEYLKLYAKYWEEIALAPVLAGDRP